MVKGCPGLSWPSNGKVTYNKGRVIHFPVNTKATYTCNSGYKRTSGWRVRTCQANGKWNGYPGVCTKGNENVYIATNCLSEGFLFT